MGDPKRLRKKYTTPGHPFEKERIEEENRLLKEYGLKNKKEIWKAKSRIRNFRAIARRLEAERGPQRETKEKELMNKLKKIGLVGEGATLDDVLSLEVTNILDRRLQTLVFKKGLARTIKQARQFIVHGHIAIDGRKVDVPGYIVPVDEEGKIGYYGEPPAVMRKTEETMPATVEKEPETKPKIVEKAPETKPAIPQKEGSK
ncbi:MAG: 30S ribosomal protein S4 [Candidatus Diapherotrites archaeon]|nr:30S ribosomal protein S4 [Candidatus Diapherotrites archaeon]